MLHHAILVFQAPVFRRTPRQPQNTIPSFPGKLILKKFSRTKPGSCFCIHTWGRVVSVSFTVRFTFPRMIDRSAAQCSTAWKEHFIRTNSLMCIACPVRCGGSIYRLVLRLIFSKTGRWVAITMRVWEKRTVGVESETIEGTCLNHAIWPAILPLTFRKSNLQQPWLPNNTKPLLRLKIAVLNPQT